MLDMISQKFFSNDFLKIMLSTSDIKAFLIANILHGDG
jgi:hypothetical protein